ncbi:MAG TPA: carboxymuconolactone decarboxylase family protein [Gemmatimonadaceae bacterium]
MSADGARSRDAARDPLVPPPWGGDATFAGLDRATRLLVGAAAAVAAGSEDEIRARLAESVGMVPVAWMEEMILQSYLFAGFPRALNAMREWRRESGVEAPASDEGAGGGDAELGDAGGDGAEVGDGAVVGDAGGGDAVGGDADDGDTSPARWRARGEATCATVYGAFYEKLRGNIRALHPALDEWMIVEGYGKVLGRPGLDLRRRELCIVAACAASRQNRQLHSHLHGALHAGATSAEVEGAIDAAAPMLSADEARSVRMLWARVLGKG